MFGYYGYYARINLTTGEITKQTFSEETYRKYIGGTGMGSYILYQETGKETDPLGPDNVLTFNAGPIVGTKIPCSGRYHVVTKSPLTGKYGESNCGGKFGPAIKASGFDGFIITGKAKTPVYLLINDGCVTICDASDLWGTDSVVCQEKLIAQYGKKARTVCIGEGGEKLSNMAAIMDDGKAGRAAARGGMGAVMGSKNLKAIVAMGTQKAPLPEQTKAELSAYCKQLTGTLTESLKVIADHGTGVNFEHSIGWGDAPIKNWSTEELGFPAEKISGPTMTKTILTGKYHCANCVVGCGRDVKTEGKYAMEGGGPEYETLSMFGSNLLIDDLSAIAYCHDLCNKYGLDLISVSSTIGFALEAYESGVISNEDTNGLVLRFGDPDCVVELIHQIGQRRGIGDILANGSKLASEYFNVPHMAVHVMGLECPGHDPRAAHGVALEYVTAPRGGCHLSAFGHDFELMGGGFPIDGFDFGAFQRFGNDHKAVMISKYQDFMALVDSMVFCKSAAWGTMQLHTSFATMLRLLTGWDITDDELKVTGERIMNLKHLYNIKCGWTPNESVLPHKILAWHRGKNPLKEELPDIGYMLSEYNELRGRDQYGYPRKATLERLGLDKL